MLKAYSIEHLPPNGVEVTDAEVISMRNASGADPHPGHAVVSGSPAAIQGVNLQAATTCFVDDGDSIELKKADGSGFIGGTVTAVANVPAGVLAELRLPGGETVLKDMQASINVGQFDNSGSFAANVNVANNLPSFKLANAVTRIAVHLGPIQVTAGAKTVGATVNIDQGAWQPFPLGASTDAIVSNGDTIQIENQGSTQGVSGTMSVAAAAGIAKLPANSAMVANNVAIQVPVTGTYTNTITPQVSAAGAITGFTLS